MTEYLSEKYLCGMSKHTRQASGLHLSFKRIATDATRKKGHHLIDNPLSTSPLRQSYPHAYALDTRKQGGLPNHCRVRFTIDVDDDQLSLSMLVVIAKIVNGTDDCQRPVMSL